MGRFILDRTQANLLKQGRGSLPAISSALNCFAAFCEMRTAQPFPVTERIVLEWGAVFSDTATFANYISHLQKVCFFAGLSVDWLTPAVRHVARGLKKCQDTSFKFPNFIRVALLLQIIQHEPADSEFAQAFWLSFLFAFRVPSETLQLVRAYTDDEITAFTPYREKALIGLRTTPQGSFLVTKFKWRKNIAGGCILRMPCFRSGDQASSRSYCPVHVLWPAIRGRVPPGEPLFSAVNRRNFNRILKAALSRPKADSAARYTSHGFRRGAVQELKECGSPWAVLASDGLWRSPAFRGYVDMAEDVELGVRNLFPVDLDSESDAEAV